MRTTFFLIGIKVASLYNALVLFGEGMGLHNFDSTARVLRNLSPGMWILDSMPTHDPYVTLAARIAGIFINGLGYLILAFLLAPLWSLLMAPEPVNTDPGAYIGK